MQVETKSLFQSSLKVCFSMIVCVCVNMDCHLIFKVICLFVFVYKVSKNRHKPKTDIHSKISLKICSFSRAAPGLYGSKNEP